MRPFALLALLLLLPAARASAQGRVLEYGQGGMRADLQRYHAEVQRDVSDLIVEWRTAWERGRPDEVARLYHGDAVLHPRSGGMLRGRRAIETHLASEVGAGDRVQFELLDFGTSGELAYMAGRIFVSGSDTGGATAIGTDFLVLRRNDVGQWRIVSHLSRPEIASQP